LLFPIHPDHLVTRFTLMVDGFDEQSHFKNSTWSCEISDVVFCREK